MKTHITRNEVNIFFDEVYTINDNQLEGLNKKGYKAVYYNAGTYGWNYDVYSAWFNGKRYALIEGYRPMTSKRIDNELFNKLMKEGK